MLSGVPRVPKALIQKFWRVEDSDASVGIQSSFSPECVSRSKFGFEEIAALLGVSVASVKEWRLRGLLCAHRYNDKGDYLFEVPGDDLPKKNARKRSYLQKKQLTTIATNEVQYET